jgi:hypothetical protein
MDFVDFVEMRRSRAAEVEVFANPATSEGAAYQLVQAERSRRIWMISISDAP